MDNVIKFPNNSTTILNPELRTRIEDGLKPFTDKPVEATTTIEQVICTYAIYLAKRFAETMGKKLGDKIASKIASNE